MYGQGVTGRGLESSLPVSPVGPRPARLHPLVAGVAAVGPTALGPRLPGPGIPRRLVRTPPAPRRVEVHPRVTAVLPLVLVLPRPLVHTPHTRTYVRTLTH